MKFARNIINSASLNAVGNLGGTVWLIQVNRLKRRELRRAKEADRLEPKRYVARSECRLTHSHTDNNATGAEAEPNPSISLGRNVVSLLISL